VNLIILLYPCWGDRRERKEEQIGEGERFQRKGVQGQRTEYRRTELDRDDGVNGVDRG
jgi:hypothetical protein